MYRNDNLLYYKPPRCHWLFVHGLAVPEYEGGRNAYTTKEGGLAMSKGSSSRVTDQKAFRDNHGAIDWSKGVIVIPVDTKTEKIRNDLPEISKARIGELIKG